MTPRTRFSLLVAMLAITALCCGCGDDDPARPVTTGTIVIDATPDEIDAAWTLTDTGDFNMNGTGDQTVANLDPGDYTVTWDDVDDYMTPSDATATLTADTTITLEGVYAPIGMTATFVTEFGGPGTDALEFDLVGDIAIDPSGNLFICDNGNDRVQKVGPDGLFKREFEYESPWDIQTDEAGYVYVWGDWELSRYDGNGVQQPGFYRLNYSTAWGVQNRFAVSRTTDELVLMNVNAGHVSVYDSGEAGYTSKSITKYQLLRVQKTNGEYLGILGGQGEGDGQFLEPYAAEFDGANRLYVMDPERDIVQIFEGDAYVGTAPSPASISEGTGFCIDDDNRLYYRNYNTIEAFSADGLYTDSFTVPDPGIAFGAKYIQTRNEPGTDAVLLYAANGHSVVVYRLTFVGW